MPRIPKGKSPHAVELLLTIEAPLLVRGYDHFSVRRRHEVVSKAPQLCSELQVVVDLAIEHEHDASIRTAHGLIARREVDYGQTSMPEADVSILVEALAVRSAVRQGARDAAKRVPIDSSSRVLM